MSLYIASLNSGSNGNCYYIGNEDEAIFVDAGLPCREIERRMLRLGLSIKKIKAIFISHEHTDHISGVEVLSKKYQLPVYITEPTLENSSMKIDKHLAVPFSPHQAIIIGALSIVPFPKQHDANDPHSFTIAGNGVTIGVFTDIGTCCSHVNTYFGKCNAAFLEANYDEQMLMDGKYPWHLKNRIHGSKGHLSNMQSLSLFTGCKSPFMTHLLLAHLSKDNNNPELVYDLFKENAGNTEIIIASRYKESAVYHIQSKDANNTKTNYLQEVKGCFQLSLF
ncbi:MAG TPA: MBL fold metallo-hydrolase [Flavipsychrobacter sp.]|nr:MBL fold metallo-hydrolase [Flavipsychrobacter sp.]